MPAPYPVPETTRAMPYHEFYLDDFQPRDHYRPLGEHIRRAGQNLLAEKARDAHPALHPEGVTCTVYDGSAKGIERVGPKGGEGGAPPQILVSITPR